MLPVIKKRKVRAESFPPVRLSSASGVLSSPNFPQNFPTEQQCAWEIVGPPGSRISVAVDEIDIPNTAFLQVREGPPTPLATEFNNVVARNFSTSSNLLGVSWITGMDTN